MTLPPDNEPVRTVVSEIARAPAMERPDWNDFKAGKDDLFTNSGGGQKVASGRGTTYLSFSFQDDRTPLAFNKLRHSRGHESDKIFA